MSRLALALALVLAVAGCESYNPFGSKEEPKLEGERIAVLLENPDIEPDPLIADLDVVLPAPQTNADWPQSGGVPSHVMNHLALADAPKEVWERSIGSGSSSTRRLLASPVVADGVVYTMDSQSEVRAFSAEDGDRLWSVDVSDDQDEEGDLGGGIAYDKGRLYVATGFAQVIALDAETGDVIWRERAFAPLRSAPTIADGRVFALTIDNRLLALSAEDGRTLWTHTGIAEVAGILGGASPAVFEDTVVVPHSSGEIFALRTDTGRALWSDSLAAVRRADPVSPLADIRSNPVIDGGLVFAVSHSGRMVAIDMRTGGRVWEKQVGGIQAPWVAGDYLYVVTQEGMVLCLAKANGRIRWVRELPRWQDEEAKEGAILWAGPVLAGDRLILAGSQGEALSISPYTGEVLGKLELPDDVLIAPIVANGTVYFLTDDAELVALR